MPDLDDLARLVRSTRDAQKRYFREKTPQNLNVARDWERKLDAAVDAVLAPPTPGLFE